MQRTRLLAGGGAIAAAVVTIAGLQLSGAQPAKPLPRPLPKPTLTAEKLTRKPAKGPHLLLALQHGTCLVGANCTIAGHNFMDGKHAQKVKLIRSGVETVTKAIWFDQLMYLVVPTDIATGDYELVVEWGDGTRSNALPIRMIAGRPSGEPDGDGVTGAADCSDFDGLMHTGAGEVDDLYDEDCIGIRISNTGSNVSDADGDGYLRDDVCNVALGSIGVSRERPDIESIVDSASSAKPSPRLTDGTFQIYWICGSDPDDTNAAIRPGAMICGDDGKPYVAQPGVPVVGTPGIGSYRDRPGYFELASDPQWKVGDCGSGNVCVKQPNGTGYCARK
jgi:hypothetical protein